MGSNRFGTLLQYTTFGESHGPFIGVVVDGFPAGIEIDPTFIQKELFLRRPSSSKWVSPREEKEEFQIVSGVFQNKSTGAPITFLIPNQNTCKQSYDNLKNVYRPGHANFTYLHKYGIFDFLGGGRASARETAARVAAGALAKIFLQLYGIEVIAFVKKIQHHEMNSYPKELSRLQTLRKQSSLFCVCPQFEKTVKSALEEVIQEKDSLGGCIEFYVEKMPIGLGEPIYQKLDALLAFALMSIPATKAFEVGEGISSSLQKGSSHNDGFHLQEGKVQTTSNNAGGILAGISTGSPLYGRVYFKPTSSIQKEQRSVDFVEKKEVYFTYNSSSRHDPCVTIRAVPVVEAMVALVLADLILQNRCAKA